MSSWTFHLWPHVIPFALIRCCTEAIRLRGHIATKKREVHASICIGAIFPFVRAPAVTQYRILCSQEVGSLRTWGILKRKKVLMYKSFFNPRAGYFVEAPSGYVQQNSYPTVTSMVSAFWFNLHFPFKIYTTKKKPMHLKFKKGWKSDMLTWFFPWKFCNWAYSIQSSDQHFSQETFRSCHCLNLIGSSLDLMQLLDTKSCVGSGLKIITGYALATCSPTTKC